MKKICVACTTFLFVFASVYAQNDSARIQSDTIVQTDTMPVVSPLAVDQKKEPVYKLNPGADIPVTAVGTIWSLYAFTKIYSKDPSSAEQILSLQKSNVNGFDRWAIRPYSKSIDDASY